jgi:hypothetical protein
MKLEPMSAYALRNKVIREPLYTLPEIADKLGMEHKIIAGYMKSKREGKPKPVMREMSPLSFKNKRYKLSEFKAWIKKMEEYK